MDNNDDNKQISPDARHRVIERMKTKYPDKSFDDDEVLFGQISDDYDDYDGRLGKYEEDERVLLDMFDKDPKSAKFLASWHNGGDPIYSLIKTYGKDDIMDAINDEKRLDEIAKANKEYVERVAKERELDTQYEQNLANSLNEIDKIQEERGLSDEDIDEAMKWIIGIIGDGVMGKFSPETIEMALKAIHHDNDVEQAGSEGEIRGRNAKIDERLRKRDKGDGVANLSGKNSSTGRQKPHSSIFDLAAEAM